VPRNAGFQRARGWTDTATARQVARERRA
jgi:hypothetical protein